MLDSFLEIFVKLFDVYISVIVKVCGNGMVYLGFIYKWWFRLDMG